MKSRLKLKISILTFLLLFGIFISSPRYFPALCISVTIHESGHIFMARIRKIPLKELDLGIFGAKLTPASSLFSYTDEMLLCIGGPFFNFLSAGIAACFLSPTSLFIMSSLALGGLNLLPIDGFDGGRILSALMSKFLSLRAVATLSKAVSFVFIFSLWSLSLYLLLRVGNSLPLFIFSVSMFAKIFI